MVTAMNHLWRAEADTLGRPDAAGFSSGEERKNVKLWKNNWD